MPLAHDENDHDGIQTQMRAVLVTNALHHWKDGPLKSVGAFSLRTLERYGLIEEMGGIDLPGGTAAVLTSPDHEQRFSQPVGPLLFVGKGISECSVIDPSEMLAHNDPGVRLAAMQFFDELPDALLSKRSRRALNEGRQEIASSDSARWIPAGKMIDERLRNDIYLVLSGFNQCYELGFEEGVQEYLNRLLRPDSHLVASIDLDVWDPVTERELVKKLVAEASQADTIERAMEDFYRQFGHLPLAAHLGAASVVTEWRKGRDEKGVWQALWAWADKRTSPVPRFHATIACLADPLIVPNGLESVLWGEVAEIAKGGSPSLKDSRWSEAWKIRERLAQHLGNHLSCLTPGTPSERVFGVAWWLTERISELLPSSPSILRRFREAIVNPEVDRSSYLQNMTHPPVGRSGLRYLTHFTNRVWSTSIVCELAGATWLSARCQPAQDDRLGIEDAAINTLLQTYPSATGKLPPVFSFDQPIESLDGFWKDAPEPNDGNRALFNDLLRSNRRLSTSSALTHMIEALSENDNETHMRYALALKVRAYTVDGNDADINELFYESGKWKKIVSISDVRVLSLLFEALVETAAQSGDHWPSTVPHMFAYASEQAADDEHRRTLFALTLFACLSTNTVGAVDRLMHGFQRSAFIPFAETWCGQLQSMLSGTSPWASGRIRSILSSLKVDEIPDSESE